MDRISAKISQKIGVLLEHQHFHPGTRQQKAQHHPSRSCPRNAASRSQTLRIRFAFLNGPIPFQRSLDPF
jgi:hypothetical protein